jgi:hypothetical protein
MLETMPGTLAHAWADAASNAVSDGDAWTLKAQIKMKIGNCFQR